MMPDRLQNGFERRVVREDVDSHHRVPFDQKQFFLRPGVSRIEQLGSRRDVSGVVEQSRQPPSFLVPAEPLRQRPHHCFYGQDMPRQSPVGDVVLDNCEGFFS